MAKPRNKSPQSILKAKGLIPKHWDLRTPTNYQKRVIRERSKLYSEVIKHPDKFASRKYGKETRDKLKKAGYFGEGDRVLIPNFGDKSQRTLVRDDYITIHRTLTSPGSPRRGEHITERVYLHSGPRLLEELQKKFKGNLPAGEYWALKVGDNNTFISNHSKNLYQLMHYAAKLAGDWGQENQKEEEDEEESPNQYARNHIHLVRFKFDNGRDTEQLPYNPSNPADPSNFVKRGKSKKWANKRGK